MYSKTELTEIKYIIFSRYMNQKVLWNGVELVELEKCWNWKHESFRLQLKPLSSITDEERIQVAKFEYYHRNFNVVLVEEQSDNASKVNFVRESGSVALYSQNVFFEDCPMKTDYLRSLGYATKQLVILNGKPVTLSVEQQIELGIIETKN